MSYLDQAELMNHKDWPTRAQTAIREQAVAYSDDSREDYKRLAWEVIQNPTISYNFPMLLITEPGVDEDMTDEQLKIAVQTAWPKWGRAYVLP